MKKLFFVVIPILLLTLTNVQASSLTQNLIGYWKFDGNGLDSSGEGRDLDLYGGVGFDTGLFGSALDLNGNANQYARRPTDDNIYDFESGDFTLQVWVNLNSISSEQILIEKLYGPDGPGWSLTYYARSSKWHFFAFPFAKIYTVDQAIALGVWHQIILRRSGTDIDLFYDNNTPDWWEQHSVVNPQQPIRDTFYPLLAGKRNELDGHKFALDGKLDEIAIWNRALSDDEIDLLWNGGSGTEIVPSVPEPPVCSSSVNSISELKMEVENLDTSPQTITALSKILDNAQKELDKDKNKKARNQMKNFIGKVVSKSNLKETSSHKIGAEEANNLICAAANVLIGIPLE